MKFLTISLIFLTSWRIGWMNVSAMIPHHRKWERFSANLEKLFVENIKVVELFHARPLTCVLKASSVDFANVACIKNTSCVYLYVSRVFWYEGPQTDDGYQCYVSHYCKHEDVFVAENESVTAIENVSGEQRRFACHRLGLIDTGVPVPATNCSEPFTQFSWGCVYESDFEGTYIDAKRHCQSYGANLASPKTVNDSLAMLEYLTAKYSSSGPRFWVALELVNDVWQWTENGREPNAEEWGPDEPYGDGIASNLRYKIGTTTYAANDVDVQGQYPSLCHVWNVY